MNSRRTIIVFEIGPWRCCGTRNDNYFFEIAISSSCMRDFYIYEIIIIIIIFHITSTRTSILMRDFFTFGARVCNMCVASLSTLPCLRLFLYFTSLL